MTDPKRPLRVPAPRPRRSFWPRLARPSPRLGISSAALFLALGRSLSPTPFLPGCPSLRLSLFVPLCVSLTLSPWLPQSVCLSVCKSLVPSKLSDPPRQHRTDGPQGRRRSPSSPPAAFPPRRPAAQPAGPARPLAPGLPGPRRRRRCQLRASRPGLEF